MLKTTTSHPNKIPNKQKNNCYIANDNTDINSFRFGLNKKLSKFRIIKLTKLKLGIWLS